MFIRDVVNDGVMPALEKMLAFTQARHRVLAENIANVDTPGYKTKHLDPKAFQHALREALDSRKKTGSSEFRISGTDQVKQDEFGRLNFTPSEKPAENILFHDQTNIRIEKQMAMLAENGMMHQAITELLNNRLKSLTKAIHGRAM